jgi:enoyl-CoA hydratase/carnithine racemase
MRLLIRRDFRIKGDKEVTVPDTATSEPSILVSQVDERVLRITLNRPHKRNAMDAEARQLLLAALRDSHGKASVIILTGAGRTFCSGMDLGQLTTGEADDNDELNRSWNQVQDEIRRHPAIVIASAEGYALGGGSTLINVCDLAVVAEDVQIGIPELGFGYYPGLAGPAAQLRLTTKRAAWMILTAKRINGVTAVEWGMANLAVPADELESQTLDLARHVAQFDPTALEYTKKALWTVPMQISEWRAALEYGAYVNAEIHSRTQTHEGALKNFIDGVPNPGQGK